MEWTFLDDGSCDMGCHFDFFHPCAHEPTTELLTEEQKKNRKILHEAMSENFNGLVNEWWHFTMKDEPFPSQSFENIQEILKL